MELNYDDFKNNPQIRTDLYSLLNGLDTFRKDLEKDFFSTVNISSPCCNQDEVSDKLVVDMYCNLGLAEMLSHFNKGNWGATYEEQRESSPLLNSFRSLRNQNILDVEIDELTLFLKDTSIIINSAGPCSIPLHWDSIITEMGNHFIHFTKGLTEMPSEIYLPVFKGTTTENIPTLLTINTEAYDQSDYFKYWGLYFESHEDAVIYDLENKSIIEGDLFMLNR
ncbi:hypothetical protein K8352_09975 [Flavobacteriaceae bacterium F89]|uniref:Uncharacterized protein n=1 Tax=Cerina litoralis TaxID=2874477 RepID=A0AAE3EVI5_9FLAO|nr:hypothetical protein [Cerina litoralis]MCG2461074.1 hypothetical protein [Cerina litoralis]